MGTVASGTAAAAAAAAAVTIVVIVSAATAAASATINPNAAAAIAMAVDMVHHSTGAIVTTVAAAFPLRTGHVLAQDSSAVCDVKRRRVTAFANQRPCASCFFVDGTAILVATAASAAGVAPSPVAAAEARAVVVLARGTRAVETPQGGGQTPALR